MERVECGICESLFQTAKGICHSVLCLLKKPCQCLQNTGHLKQGNELLLIYHLFIRSVGGKQLRWNFVYCESILFLWQFFCFPTSCWAMKSNSDHVHGRPNQRDGIVQHSCVAIVPSLKVNHAIQYSRTKRSTVIDTYFNILNIIFVYGNDWRNVFLVWFS